MTDYGDETSWFAKSGNSLYLMYSLYGNWCEEEIIKNQHTNSQIRDEKLSRTSVVKQNCDTADFAHQMNSL